MSAGDPTSNSDRSQLGWGHPQVPRRVTSPDESAEIRSIEREIKLVHDRSADRRFVGAITGGVAAQLGGTVLVLIAVLSPFLLDGIGPTVLRVLLSAGALLILAGGLALVIGLVRLLHTIQATYLLVRRL